jgi:hypothetical protein
MRLSLREYEEDFPLSSRQRREDLSQGLWEMLHVLKAEAQAKGNGDLLRRVAENITRLELI